MASSHSRSKKQSAGSRKRLLSLPEDFVLYLDENLHNCKPILKALVQRGVRHERHLQHFQPGTEDSVWLPFVGQQGWILHTKDKRIRFSQMEKAAVRRYHVREYFSSGNFTGPRWRKSLRRPCQRWQRFAGNTIRRSSRAYRNRERSVCDSSNSTLLKSPSNRAPVFRHLHICTNN
jgi:hypothetical protein